MQKARRDWPGGFCAGCEINGHVSGDVSARLSAAGPPKKFQGVLLLVEVPKVLYLRCYIGGQRIGFSAVSAVTVRYQLNPFNPQTTWNQASVQLQFRAARHKGTAYSWHRLQMPSYKYLFIPFTPFISRPSSISTVTLTYSYADYRRCRLLGTHQSTPPSSLPHSKSSPQLIAGTSPPGTSPAPGRTLRCPSTLQQRCNRLQQAGTCPPLKAIPWPG